MKRQTALMSLFVITALLFTISYADTRLPGKYPEASRRALVTGDLSGKSLMELKIMRNEIFARHGYIFRSPDMKRYFSKQKWYRPRYKDVTSKLTNTEKANIALIKKHEASAGPEEVKSRVAELISQQKRRQVFRASWGSGPAEIGLEPGQEAETRGPWSFIVDSRGMIYVLDAVNARVQVYSEKGQHVKSIPLPHGYFEDIAVNSQGELFLLDLWRSKGAVVINQKGRVVKSIALKGMGIAEPGSVTGIWMHRDGLWVESNGNLVQVCDAAGNAYDRRLMVKGIIGQGHKYVLRSKVLGDITVFLTRQKYGSSELQKYHVYFDIPVMYTMLLDADAKGNIYLGADLLDQSRRKSPPYSIDENHQVIVVLDAKGSEKRRIYIPPASLTLGINHTFRLLPDGTIYYLELRDDGAAMWEYSN